MTHGRNLRAAGPMLRALACLVAMVGAAGSAVQGQTGAGEVRGRIELLRDSAATDAAEAVVWLEGEGLPAEPPATVAVGTEDKEFLPHLVVIPAGSVVEFPNHDPFDHNVFSRSESSAFDLGLYARGETRSRRFDSPGVVHVYCNIHAEMSALVVVRNNRFHTRPAPDGSFRLAGVPPGRYRLRVWHEHAPEVMREIEVGPDGAEVVLRLDARGYRWAPHLNKYGRPYPRGGRRY